MFKVLLVFFHGCIQNVSLSSVISFSLAELPCLMHENENSKKNE